jgi:hypothetical protein
MHLRSQNNPQRALIAYNSCDLQYLMPKKLDAWTAQKDLISENHE